MIIKIFSTILFLLITLISNGSAIAEETILRCGFGCKGKTYDNCKKDFFDKNKKYETKETTEKRWLSDTVKYQIFDDKLISTLGDYKSILQKLDLKSEKYYVFYRGIPFNDSEARFQIIAFDRNELISLLKNFKTSLNSDNSINWPERINSNQKILNYVNYMFVKYKNPKFNDELYVFEGGGEVCKIIDRVKSKF